MPVDYFTLHHRAIHFADLLDPAYRPPAEINGYEGRVIELVREWLLGAEEFVIRSSGSTGPAKAIPLTRSQLAASAKRSIEALRLAAGDPALVCLNVETVGGLLGLIRALQHELPLTVIEPTADVLTAAGVDSHFATVSLVPLQLREVLLHGRTGRRWLSWMKAVLVGGGPVPPNLAQDLYDVTTAVYHTYGMTETASHVALRRLDMPHATDYFTAMAGVEVRLGENDALEVRADVTRHAWLTTTDRGELLPPDPTTGAARFRWLGRLDDVINSGGVKVDAARVRQVLDVTLAELRLPHTALIVGVPDERLGERLTAVLVGEQLAPDTLDFILGKLRDRLDRYEVPKEIRLLSPDELPRLPSGKPDGRGLAAKLASTEAD